MISFPVDLVLLVALVMTTACVVVVYRKLKALEAHQAHYERILKESSAALITAHQAIAALNTDGRELLFSLGGKIEQAHAAIAEIDSRNAAARRTRLVRDGEIERSADVAALPQRA
ncbi:hypothetical protein GCM10007301_03940 [Azorhizobium oxalatiphilum]|uniref:Uncharacterized protein n=1 Tax=Azorhizobium oxalatiphilum TaxID=980631 RepID=A0A917F576_9HYPH|nr:hypothetical protein [Azorhizobium oxalatiphilum]GGF47853.1 hypothetical protein GCM10007301_03940 [Azorhizobium oxalatiphilum]